MMNDGMVVIRVNDTECSRSVYVYDINNISVPLRRFPPKEKITEFQVNRRWVVVTTDATISVRDLDDDQEGREISKTQRDFIKLSGDYLLVTSVDGTVVYNLSGTENPVEIGEPFCRVVGDHLFTREKGIYDINVRLLSDLKETKYTLKGNPSYYISSILIDGDNIFISYRLDKIIRVWDTVNPEQPPKRLQSTLFEARMVVYEDCIIAYSLTRYVVFDRCDFKELGTIDTSNWIMGVKDGLMVTRTNTHEIILVPLFPTYSVIPLLVADVLPSDILYDVFKLF
jgi:WD40 repeat protein